MSNTPTAGVSSPAEWREVALTGGRTARLLGPDVAPAVMLFHAWWGLTPAVDAAARHVAGRGRRVVAVDLYAGRTAADVEEARRLRADLDMEQAFADVDSAVAMVVEQGSPWAAVGWSMGASFASEVAGAGPSALALFYGGDHPQPSALRPGAPVQLHLAEHDTWTPGEESAAVAAAFTDAGFAVETFTYPGTAHWFAESDRPEHDPAATALAWERVDRLLDEQLPLP